MSRRHMNDCSYDEKGFSIGNCCCSFPTLVILILIILQFNRRGNGLLGLTGAEGAGIGSFETVDNSILFIIALFYLSCCNPCKR